MDFNKLKTAANDPVATLNSRVQASGKPLGLAFSSYFPLEVLDALGLEGAFVPPVPKPDYPEAEAIFQAFVCNCMRSAADTILAGGLDVGLLAATTGCDSRLALATTLRTAGVDAPVAMFRLPVIVGSPIAIKQAGAALIEFCAESGTAIGSDLDKDALVLACREREKVRIRLANLFDGLGNNGTGASTVYTAAVAAQVMAPGEFLQAADGDLPVVDNVPTGARILLSGSSIPSPKIFEDLESLGARVVVDDTCTGTRAACRRVGPLDGDPLEAIGASLINRPLHGPTMMEPAHERIRQLVDTARARRVQAAILLHYKFCDPHAFEAPGLVKAFEDASIRCLVLEVDREPALAARDRTRVETLLEGIA